MDDLIQIALFAAIVLFSLLGGAKKRADQQRRAQRGQPGGPRRPSRPASGRQPGVARPQGQARQRQEGLEAILDLLRGELPTPPVREPPPESADVTVELDDEARPLETTSPLDAASHRRFHEQYIQPTLAPRPARRSRYRLTPKTGREAVVWTAIFSPPKGYE